MRQCLQHLQRLRELSGRGPRSSPWGGAEMGGPEITHKATRPGDLQVVSGERLRGDLRRSDRDEQARSHRGEREGTDGAAGHQKPSEPGAEGVRAHRLGRASASASEKSILSWSLALGRAPPHAGGGGCCMGSTTFKVTGSPKETHAEGTLVCSLRNRKVRNGGPL